MKLCEILTEMPQMVSTYPPEFGKSAQRLMQWAKTELPDDAEEEYNDGRYTIMSVDRDLLILYDKQQPIGTMELSGPVKIDVNVPAWQVFNVFLLPNQRNKRLGLMLYNHVIHRRKEAFASMAAMTPDSRRIYTSLFKDPTVQVYALVHDKRQELTIGDKGITTGNPKRDNLAVFVARAT